MISTDSLAGFTASVPPVGIGRIQPARVVGGQPPPVAPTSRPPATAAPSGTSGNVSPDRILPRGSLLDLSV
jgi:hypothetical protein